MRIFVISLIATLEHKFQNENYKLLCDKNAIKTIIII